MAALSILLGLAIGWAWGVIAMKAALATRPAADLTARYALLQQMAQNATNTGQASGESEYLQIRIFEGVMLDARVTVTYFCMMDLFIYLVVCPPRYSTKSSDSLLGPPPRRCSQAYSLANVGRHRSQCFPH